jgi:hypothetical protein
MSVIGLLKENIAREKAHLQGKGYSEARMIKNAIDIPEIAKHLNGANGAAPRAIAGAVVRMKDGKPMVFHTDGSLRHAVGRKTTKAARKELKRARRAKQKPS